MGLLKKKSVCMVALFSKDYPYKYVAVLHQTMQPQYSSTLALLSLCVSGGHSRRLRLYWHLSLSLFHKHNLYNPLSLPLTLALTGAGPLVIELTYLASLLLPSSMLLPWWCTRFIMCHVNLVILALEHKTFWIDLKTMQRILLVADFVLARTIMLSMYLIQSKN